MVKLSLLPQKPSHSPPLSRILSRGMCDPSQLPRTRTRPQSPSRCSHNRALSLDVPGGFRSEFISGIGGSRDGAGRVRGRRHRAMAERGGRHRSRRVLKEPGCRWNADAGQDRTALALLETANSPSNRAQGSKWKPHQGRRTDACCFSELVADTFTPLELGGFSSLGLPVSLCHVKQFTLIGISATLHSHHIFFFF